MSSLLNDTGSGDVDAYRSHGNARDTGQNRMQNVPQSYPPPYSYQLHDSNEHEERKSYERAHTQHEMHS